MATNANSLNSYASAMNELALLHAALLTNGQLVASGTADVSGSNLPTSVIKRPWLEEPDGSVPYDQAQVAALPAVAGTVTVVMMTVPTGMDGVINAFSWNFTGGGFVQGSGDIQAQLFRNGAAVRNFDNILIEKGTIQTPRPISPIRVYSNQVITLVINHLNNGALNGNVVGSLVGYFYPAQS
jgi:hypothetical protein